MTFTKRALTILGALAACSMTIGNAPPPPFTNVVTSVSQNSPASDLPVATTRHKFPGEDTRIVDAIEFVNRMVNAQMTYVPDMVQYGRAEYWVMMPESMQGDCEDYALTKLAILQRAGFPIVSHSRITLLAVMTPGGGGHAVLEIRMPNGAIAVLDNNHHELMTRSELETNHGYRFQDW